MPRAARSRRRMQDGISNGDDKHWHLSRGIPVALIVSLFLMFLAQTGTGAWWASNIDKRMDVVEKVQGQMAPQGERLTRLEEKVVAVQAGVSRIEAILTKPAMR